MRFTGHRNRSAIYLLVGWMFTLAAGCSVSTGETCSKCNSTRQSSGTFTRSVKVTYRSPGYAACRHRWDTGISPSVEPPIPDGKIVLVKKGKTLGAFIPRHQQMTPEQFEYDWYYRSDGKGTFRASDAGRFRYGHGTGGSVAFGSIDISWSGHDAGKGYIYYPHCPGEPTLPDDVRICVTSETDIKTIDAADSKWVYRAAVSDPGIRADGTQLP